MRRLPVALIASAAIAAAPTFVIPAVASAAVTHGTEKQPHAGAPAPTKLAAAPAAGSEKQPVWKVNGVALKEYNGENVGEGGEIVDIPGDITFHNDLGSLNCLTHEYAEIWNRKGRGEGEILSFSTVACTGLSWEITHQANGSCASCVGKTLSIPGDPFVPAMTTLADVPYYGGRFGNPEPFGYQPGRLNDSESAKLIDEWQGEPIVGYANKAMEEELASEKASIGLKAQYDIHGSTSDYEYGRCIEELNACHRPPDGKIYLEYYDGNRVEVVQPSMAFQEVVPGDGLEFAYKGTVAAGITNGNTEKPSMIQASPTPLNSRAGQYEYSEYCTGSAHCGEPYELDGAIGISNAELSCGKKAGEVFCKNIFGYVEGGPGTVEYFVEAISGLQWEIGKTAVVSAE
jgi:hypothetical protein